MPDWDIPDAPYKILTLNSALDNSPSITVNLEFQKIGKTLVSPLSTKKNKPSIYDLFFMENPQDYCVNKEMISDSYNMQEDTTKNNIIEAVTFDDEEEVPEEDYSY